MFDRGLSLTLQAIRRQLAAMPHELYLIRLIHHYTRRPFPGERLWTADQLTNLATIRFLRVRNREGCDVYIQPYAVDQNAGYILVDLDRAEPAVLPRCGQMDMNLAWCSRPARAICRPGYMSVPPLWNLSSPRPLAGSWRVSTVVTGPVPTGAIWVDLPASLLRFHQITKSFGKAICSGPGLCGDVMYAGGNLP